MPPPTSRSSYPNPSVPTSLYEAWRQLPAERRCKMSAVLAQAMRADLEAAGVDVPVDETARTRQATQARATRRVETEEMHEHLRRFAVDGIVSITQIDSLEAAGWVVQDEGRWRYTSNGKERAAQLGYIPRGPLMRTEEGGAS